MGKGSFNWRYKFPLTWPRKDRQARLTVQLWDKDLFKYNDMIVGNLVDISQKMLTLTLTLTLIGTIVDLSQKMDEAHKNRDEKTGS